MKRSGEPHPKPTPKEPKAPKGLASRSAKRAQHMRDERVPLVRSLIERGVRCGICPLLDEMSVPHPPCPGIQGIHERRKSGAGGSRTNASNLVPACNWSNGLLEDEPKMMRRLFGDLLIVREVDPEWEQLGRRADRAQSSDVTTTSTSEDGAGPTTRDGASTEIPKGAGPVEEITPLDGGPRSSSPRPAGSG